MSDEPRNSTPQEDGGQGSPESGKPYSDTPGPPSGPLPIRENCWMVGYRNPESLLQCNTYVRSFDQGSRPVHVCVDPGSQFDYTVIEANIAQLLGDVGELHSFSLNHQDPDVIGNAATLCEANPNISVMVTEEVWRLAQHLRLKPARVHFANRARSELTIIGDQHRWRLVPTPFCHFRGAMAFYDPELRTLFSGDLFGGLNRVGQVHLHATETDWAGVAQFHQIYMPTRESLRYAVRQIQALQPRVEIIAPQHGHVIVGDLVPQFLERMHDLLVGQDLLALEEDESFLEHYRGVLERLIACASEFMGREECLGRLKNLHRHDGVEHLVRWDGEELVLHRDGYTAVAKLFARLAQDEPLPLANALRSAVLDACCEAGVPIPPVGAGVEEDQSPQTVGPDGIQTQAWWLA